MGEDRRYLLMSLPKLAISSSSSKKRTMKSSMALLHWLSNETRENWREEDASIIAALYESSEIHGET